MFTYQLNPDQETITITGTNKKTRKTLVIPEKINDLIVTAIGDFAFQAKSMQTKGILSITIPQTVSKIGAFAFDKNILKELALPDSITEIGKFAFANNRIDKLHLSNQLTQINRGVFENNAIEELVIPNKILTIKKEAFKRNRIKKLTLSEGLISIEEDAFSDNFLKIVVIPYSTKSIDPLAFGNKKSDVIRLHASHNKNIEINQRSTAERIKLL